MKIRKKAIGILFLVLALFVSGVSLPVTARAEEAPKCIEISPGVHQAAFDYMQEIYTEKYPEMALRFKYGTEQDRLEFETLANIITEDTSSDLEKVQALILWTNRNIKYDVNSSAYPTDVFHHRIGNCLGYALFISQLLRLEGIPSVAVDGWRADMTLFTHKELFEELGFDGHAWIYVYLDGSWIMFDPLWGGTEPITDPSFMAAHYFVNSIEGITIVPDGVAEGYMYRNGPYYNGERFMYYEPDGEIPGNSSFYLNNIPLNTTIYNSQYDGHEYLDNPTQKESMIIGEVYSGGEWIGYSDLLPEKYVYENGVQPTATIMERDGISYFMDGGTADRILCDEKDYWIEYGAFTVQTGYEGYFLERQRTLDANESVIYRLPDYLDQEAILTVSEDGYIKTLKEGAIDVEYVITRKEEDGQISNLGGGLITVSVKDKRPVADYSSTKTDISHWNLTLSGNAFTYTGKAIEPGFTITGDFSEFVKDRDFSVKYTNNKNVGTAAVTVSGIGDYKGTLKKTFKINPKGTSVSKVTPASKAFTVKWKKQAKQTSGYQIQYGLKKNFSKAKTVKVTRPSTVSKKIKKLKSNKTYYVRVRTYKTVSGKTYYSAWSKAKKVRTK